MVRYVNLPQSLDTHVHKICSFLIISIRKPLKLFPITKNIISKMPCTCTSIEQRNKLSTLLDGDLTDNLALLVDQIPHKDKMKQPAIQIALIRERKRKEKRTQTNKPNTHDNSSCGIVSLRLPSDNKKSGWTTRKLCFNL